MRIAAGLIAFGHDGFFEPGDSLVPPLQFNQISADIVVRISEIGVYLDGLPTFSNGAVEIAQKGVRPAAKGVSLGGGKRIDRTSVEFDRLPVLARHLLRVGVLEKLGRPFTRIRFSHGS